MEPVGNNNFEISNLIKNINRKDSNSNNDSSKPKEEVEISKSAGYKFEISPEAKEAALLSNSLVQVSINIVKSISMQNGNKTSSYKEELNINATFSSESLFKGDMETIEGLSGFPEDFTSPESTAKRIFDFSLGRWGEDQWGEEDSKELRSSYRDYILPAIKKGYNEARGMLGILPPKISEKLEKTMELIDNLYNDWIEQSEKEPETGEVKETVTA